MTHNNLYYDFLGIASDYDLAFQAEMEDTNCSFSTFSKILAITDNTDIGR